LRGKVSDLGFGERFGLLLNLFNFTFFSDTLEIKKLLLMNVVHLLSAHVLFKAFVVVFVECDFTSELRGKYLVSYWIFYDSRNLALFYISCSDLDNLAALSSLTAKDFLTYRSLLGLGLGLDHLAKRNNVLCTNDDIIIINISIINF
jgi:hypothetical protein